MRERLRYIGLVVSNFTLGIIGFWAGRRAARRVVSEYNLDVENNVDDIELFFEANTRTGNDYCDYLIDHPDFRLWSYRRVRDIWEQFLRYNIDYCLEIKRMEGAS